jgi:hypothetical protein
MRSVGPWAKPIPGAGEQSGPVGTVLCDFKDGKTHLVGKVLLFPSTSTVITPEQLGQECLNNLHLEGEETGPGSPSRVSSPGRLL